MLPPDGLLFEGSARIGYLGEGRSYTARSQETEHVYGRMFAPGEYQVFGRFSDAQPGPFDPVPQQPIAGRSAAVTASYGRGEVFAFCSHPEHPICPRYESLLSQVLAGDISAVKAAHACQGLPEVSSANMELLRCLFCSARLRVISGGGR